MPTRQDQAIEQVAAIIYENGLTPTEAADVNGREGWSFDVRWADGDYVGEQDFTRCSEYKLADADLKAAVAMAGRWA